MKKLFLMLAIPALVAGCASKIPMPESQAQKAANGWYALHACVKQGYMTPELAASGRNYISRMLANYSDSGKFRNYTESLAKTQPTLSRADCSTAAMMILEVKERETPPQASAPAQTYMPTFTNCNRAFGQVFCTTY